MNNEIWVKKVPSRWKQALGTALEYAPHMSRENLMHDTYSNKYNTHYLY